MIQKQSFLFCDMVSTTYHYSLAAEPEKNCLTVTTLEVYLAWYKANIPSWTEQPLTVLSVCLGINIPTQVETGSAQDSADTQGPFF